MQAIIDFLGGIANGILALVNFLGDLIEDLVYVFQLLGHFLTQLPSFLGFLPAGVVAIFTMTFAAVIVFRIIGR